MSTTKCFACDKPTGAHPAFARVVGETSLVYVGSECAKLIKKAGKRGYQPPKGGPRLVTPSEAAPSFDGQLALVQVIETNKSGYVAFSNSRGQVGELEDLGTIQEPKRIKSGTLLDIKAYRAGAGKLVWLGVSPHYSNYGN